MKRPVDLPAAFFVFSAANAVALDTACEVIYHSEANLFCSYWEMQRDDFFNDRLTDLEEDLSKLSIQRQLLFVHAWVRALALRTS